MAQITAFPSRSFTTNAGPTFADTLRSEWSKLITHRNSRWMLILATVLAIGLTALQMWGLGVTWNDWTDADHAQFEPIQTSLIGVFFAGIVSLVIGANLVTTEYSSGMIRQTFTVTPNRTRVVLAKMIVVTGYLILPMLLLTFASIWVGGVVLQRFNVPAADVFGSDFWTVFWIGASGVYYPLLTVAIAFLLRSAAATIAVVMVTMFFPALFGGVFPQVVQERALALLPGNAIDALVLGHLNPDYPQYLEAPVAAVVALAWLIGLIMLAVRGVQRRDVG